MNMTITTRQVEDVTIVNISGRIVLGEESAALRGLLHDLLSREQKKILFNLDYIDSSGLGHLMSAFTSVRKEGAELKLLDLKKSVHDLMQITKPSAIFEIMDDEKVAIHSFELSRPGSFGRMSPLWKRLPGFQAFHRLVRHQAPAPMTRDACARGFCS